MGVFTVSGIFSVRLNLGKTRPSPTHFPCMVWARAVRSHARCRRLLGSHSRTPWPAPRAVGRARAGILVPDWFLICARARASMESQW